MTGFEVKPPYLCEMEGCESYKATNMPYCHSHLAGLRKLSRDLKKQKDKRFVPISKMSQKRAGEMAEYIPLKEEWIKANPHCLVKMEGCTRLTTEPHHRSMSADDFLVVETWLPTCRNCHDKLEALPAEVRREKLYLIEPTKKETI